MPFDYSFSEKLKDIIRRLKKKDRNRVLLIRKKADQIINSDEFTIEHYKNLQHGLSDRKRVHVDKSFVLTFSYDKPRKFVLFLDFDHHDNIYEK